jgi:hypothetical protein
MNRSQRQRIGQRAHGHRRVQHLTLWSAVGAATACAAFGAVLAGGTAQADPAAAPPPLVEVPPGVGSTPGTAPLDRGPYIQQPPTSTDSSGSGGTLVPPTTSPRSSSHSSHSGSSGSGSSGSGSRVHVRSGGS